MRRFSGVLALGLFAALAACGDDVPSLSPLNLPDGQVGEEYSATISLSGSVGGSPQWTIPLGSLPGGLDLVPDGNRARISGTPETLGSFAFVVEASGSETSVRIEYVLRIFGVSDPLTLITSELPPGEVGVNYEALVSARGGSSSGYNWEVTAGDVPDGLTLNPSGTPATSLNGVPAEAGSFEFFVTVRDSEGATDTSTLSLTIQDGTVPLTITTNSLPRGLAGAPYNTRVAAIGGTASGYQWSAVGLPDGLSIQNGTPEGRISGTPDGEATTLSVELTVEDSGGNLATRAFTFVLDEPSELRVLTSSAASGRVGEVYGAPIPEAPGEVGVLLQAFGGIPPYGRWGSTGGLPDGLTVTRIPDTDYGLLSGIPLQAGTFQASVFVVDDRGVNAIGDLEIVIANTPLTVVTDDLPVGVAGQTYTATVTAGGGAPPYAWDLAGGSLPRGLTLAADGDLFGTPLEAGTFNVVVQVTDAENLTATQPLSLDIGNPPLPLQIVTTSIPGAVEGVGYFSFLQATGGTGFEYQWSVTAGDLPPGLSIPLMGTPATSIQGVPTSTGTFPFTVTVTDSTGLQDSQAYDLTVAEP
jgi:hypothetical protein